MSHYVSTCLRCGRQNSVPEKTVTCHCGAIYDVEWPCMTQISPDGKVSGIRTSESVFKSPELAA